MNDLPNFARVDAFTHELNHQAVRWRSIWRRRYQALSDAIRQAKEDAADSRTIRGQRAAQISLIYLRDAANRMMIERQNIRTMLVQSAHPWA